MRNRKTFPVTAYERGDPKIEPRRRKIYQLLGVGDNDSTTDRMTYVFKNLDAKGRPPGSPQECYLAKLGGSNDPCDRVISCSAQGVALMKIVAVWPNSGVFKESELHHRFQNSKIMRPKLKDGFYYTKELQKFVEENFHPPTEVMRLLEEEWRALAGSRSDE